MANTYIVRVALKGRKTTKDFTIQADSTDQAESLVWDKVEALGLYTRVVMFDTSCLVN